MFLIPETRYPQMRRGHIWWKYMGPLNTQVIFITAKMCSSPDGLLYLSAISNLVAVYFWWKTYGSYDVLCEAFVGFVGWFWVLGEWYGTVWLCAGTELRGGLNWDGSSGNDRRDSCWWEGVADAIGLFRVWLVLVRVAKLKKPFEKGLKLGVRL